MVVRSSLRHEAHRLIYFQTSLCYGLQPIEQPITLEHPIRPAPNSYAVSKTAGEQYIEFSGIEYQTFRLANAYGPRNISGPLPTFYQRLTGGQACFVADTRRDFIYVQDLIDVVEKAVHGAGPKGAYHISTGSDYSIKELYEATLAALDMHPDGEVEVRPRGPDDAYTILIDPSVTERVFDWKPGTSLRQGVAEAIEYYATHGIQETYTHLRMQDDE